MPSRRINLLPQEERRKASRERGYVVALLLLVVVIAVMGVLYVYEKQNLTSRQDELGSLQGRLALVNEQVQQLKPYEAMETQRVKMTQTAAGIYASRVEWSILFEELEKLIPDQVALTNLTATVPAAMLAGGTLAGAAVPATGTTDITFAGNAYTHKDVAEFMTRLGLMPQLMNVNLVSADKLGGAGALVVFQITAQLRPFLSGPPLATPVAATGTVTQ